MAIPQFNILDDDVDADVLGVGRHYDWNWIFGLKINISNWSNLKTLVIWNEYIIFILKSNSQIATNTSLLHLSY